MTDEGWTRRRPTGGGERLVRSAEPVPWRRHGRRLPYTDAGVQRLPCFRCGNPAVHQWSACAGGNLWRPLCLACDVTLNRLVLEWMGFAPAEVKEKIAAYVSESR